MNEVVNKKLELFTQGRRAAPTTDPMVGDPSVKGVSVAWLAQVFNMSERAVKIRLRYCDPKTIRSRGTTMQTILYDIAEASSYLCKTRLTSKEYMSAIKRNELPPSLQQMVWDALLKRQKWEENAGQLWRTDKVREVLGSTFQTIKFTLQLWVDTVERTQELSEDQRNVIVQLVDALAAELYASLVENAELKATGPQLSELGELVGEETSMRELIEQADAEDAAAEDEDDGMDMV
jgi:hypothetical protein